MNPAVQESKEFKYKIKELEKKIRDMTNVIEEYPRDFEHSLLFHGIPVADKENFFSKACACSSLGQGHKPKVTDIPPPSFISKPCYGPC